MSTFLSLYKDYFTLKWLLILYDIYMFRHCYKPYIFEKLLYCWLLSPLKMKKWGRAQSLAVHLCGTAGENFAFYHYWTASNCHIWMFSTNANQYLLTKYYLCRATYFACTPQENFTILPCEVAHLTTEKGSGGNRIPKHPLSAGLCLFHWFE